MGEGTTNGPEYGGYNNYPDSIKYELKLKELLKSGEVSLPKDATPDETEMVKLIQESRGREEMQGVKLLGVLDDARQDMNYGSRLQVLNRISGKQ